MLARLIILAILAASPVLPATAGNPDRGEGPAGFEDRPGVGHPVVFRSETGGTFAPKRLVVLTASGNFATDLPPATDSARSEDHIDLSGLPVLGGLFRDRRAPIDIEREGILIGVAYRVGDTLVIDASGTPGTFDGVRLILTATLPRDGTLSFDLGPQSYLPVETKEPNGPRVGAAYVFRGALVIASDGGRPLISDWGIF